MAPVGSSLNAYAASLASRLAERLLTVMATCRQQGRRRLDFLVAAGADALQGTAAPSLLPTRPGNVNATKYCTLWYMHAPRLVYARRAGRGGPREATHWRRCPLSTPQLG